MHKKRTLCVSLLVMCILVFMFIGCTSLKHPYILDTGSLTAEPSTICYRPYVFNSEPTDIAHGDAKQWTFLYFFEYGDVSKTLNLQKLFERMSDSVKLIHSVITMRRIEALVTAPMLTEEIRLETAASDKVIDVYDADGYYIIHSSFDNIGIPLIVGLKKCRTKGYLMKVKPVGNFSDELWMKYLEAQSD